MNSYSQCLVDLKSRNSEFGALKSLKPELKRSIGILLEITPIPLDKQGFPKRTIESHLNRIIHSLFDSLCDPLFDNHKREIFLEGQLLDSRIYDEKRFWPTIYCAERLEKRDIEVVPVIRLARSPGFYDAISKHSKENNRDICLRISWDEFQLLDYCNKEIGLLLKNFKFDPSRVHLILDFEDLSMYSKQSKEYNKNDLFKKVRFLLKLFPKVTQYKSIVVAGSSLPKSFAHMKKKSTEKLSRIELWLWKKLIGLGDPLLEKIKLCDYGTEWYGYVSPGGGEKMPVYYRYTTDGDIKIYKGDDIRLGPGKLLIFSGILSGQGRIRGESIAKVIGTFTK